MRTITGGLAADAGRRRLPASTPPSSPASIRSALGSRNAWALAIAAIARSVAARCAAASSTHTNLPKCWHTAACR